MSRARHGGLKKRCGCLRRNWSECSHPWYFNFAWKGEHYRLNLDRLVGRDLKGKTDAKAEAERLRERIRAGDFRRDQEAADSATRPVTFESIGAVFIERWSKARQKRSWRSDERRHAQMAALLLPRGDKTVRLGSLPIASLTGDDLEVVLQGLRSRGLAANTYNHFRQHLRVVLTWATRKGYLTRNPMEFADLPRQTPAKRSRRLQPGEEAALLRAASPHLYRLVVAALETGCRRGELLSLQWCDVDRARRELRVRAENAKDAEDRVIPITTRLAAVLEMARHGPDGRDLPADAFVFGDEAGRRVKDITRAWTTCVMRANGITPVWERRAHEGTDRRGHRRQGGRATAECRAALAAVDLHFHDLRREAGSRWMEGGMPLHIVQQLLGHADARTTSVYLSATRIGLHESMRRFEAFRGESCTDLAQDAQSAQGVSAPSPAAKPQESLDLKVERETGIEPATSSLGSSRSTAELLPPSVRHSTPGRRDAQPGSAQGDPRRYRHFGGGGRPLADVVRGPRCQRPEPQVEAHGEP